MECQEVLPGVPTATPTQGLTVSWYNLSIWIDKKEPGGKLLNKTRYTSQRILNDVSGFVGPGSLTAIMGASGAGKTTLLATLSQRMKVGRTEGEILVNGRAVDKATMNKMSGFVPQQDLAVESLTVFEHMAFMAMMKMDRRIITGLRYRRINVLLQDLGLNKCKHTRLSKLSGGEKKRLSLAVQLLTDPPLLFCDEPTTGLDSYSAAMVVEQLAALATRGKTVICTIHQPASGLFDNFSRVLLLAGGRVAYLGHVTGAATHFASPYLAFITLSYFGKRKVLDYEMIFWAYIGHLVMCMGLFCPGTFNKAEFYVSQLAVIPGREEESFRKVHRLCNSFEASEFGRELTEELSQHRVRKGSILMQSLTSSSAGLVDESLPLQEDILKSKRLTQLYWLCWRSLIDLYRNASHHFLKLGLFLMIGLLISTSYTKLKVDQSGIQNLQGLMYLIITETIFTFTYAVAQTFPQELPILLREIGNDLYKPGPYYVSKMLILLPLTVLEAVLYTIVVFYIAGLNGGFLGLLTIIIPVVMSAVTATAYGCLLSALFESVAMATLLSVPLDFLALSFSGIFLQLGNLPQYLAWLPYVSQFYYGIEAVSISQWKQIDSIECSTDPNIPCISSGPGVLIKYGYNISNFYLDLVGLFAIYCFSHVCGFVAICHRSKKQPIY